MHTFAIVLPRVRGKSGWRRGILTMKNETTLVVGIHIAETLSLLSRIVTDDNSNIVVKNRLSDFKYRDV